MERCEFVRRADVVFHVGLLSFLLLACPLGFVSKDLLSVDDVRSSVVDLIILSLIRFRYRFGKLWPVVSMFLAEFKIVYRELTVEEFVFDDFFFVCLTSLLFSIARFVWHTSLPSASDDSKPITWTRLFRFAKGHWVRLIIGLIALIIRLPFSIAVPHYISEGIGSLISRDSDQLRSSCIALFFVGTMDALLDFWCVYIFATCKEEIIYAIRKTLFRSILFHPLKFFDVTAVGELQSRLNADTAEMAEDLSWVFRFTIEALVRITGVLGYMFICSWRLSLVVIILVPFNAVANTVFGSWISRNAQKAQDALANANTVANETFGAVQTVKSFHGEQHAIDKYLDGLGEYKHLQYKRAIVASFYYMCVSTFLMCTVIQTAIVAYGGYLAFHDQIAPERLVSFLLYLGQLQNYTNHLMNTYVNLVKCAGVSDKLFGLIKTDSENNEESNDSVATQNDSVFGTSQNSPPPTVEFETVFMRYPSRPSIKILDCVSFKVPSGSCTGIVGHSGSGKSSILSLLLRLYSVESGRVLINGASVDSIPLRLLRGRILSVVSQEPVLFRGTLRENILYSLSKDQLAAINPDVVSQMVERAIEIACISSFVHQLPEGLETKVGDRGVTLSGGQKQRIAIARAIVANPPILLLDEAMSALDPESEGMVQKALNSAMKSRTTIMVSHRISTVIESADHCIVMHKGKVVEQGNPKELLANPMAPHDSEVSLKVLYEIQQKYIN
jgi:ABC-type multidrug transport system fused ATPase/permease subunit